jgi:hypothetical protein
VAEDKTPERDAQRPSAVGWRRRTLLVSAGALVVAAGLGAQRWWHARRRVSSGMAVLAGQLRPGATLGRWKVVAIHPEQFGAVAVVMATEDGRRFQVDVLRRDASGPDGVANTSKLSLFVSNRGDGQTPTDEEEGLGALVLAEALEPYEDHDDFRGLSTLAQRNAAHPGGSFGVPLQ